VPRPGGRRQGIVATGRFSVIGVEDLRIETSWGQTSSRDAWGIFEPRSLRRQAFLTVIEPATAKKFTDIEKKISKPQKGQKTGTIWNPSPEGKSYRESGGIGQIPVTDPVYSDGNLASEKVLNKLLVEFGFEIWTVPVRIA